MLIVELLALWLVLALIAAAFFATVCAGGRLEDEARARHVR